MIYLDNNATTPLATEVLDAISASLATDWANPSSSYSEGIAVKDVIEKSKQSVAHMINADTTHEIIFTSGGTEANNWIINSSVKHFLENSTSDQKPHIITTNIEHPSIREPLNRLTLEDSASIEMTFVSVSKKIGCVSADDILSAIRPNTCLITVMMANNETGVIQPIREIGVNLAKINVQRVTTGLQKIGFHCDAAQAIGKCEVDVHDLHVDYLTIFYGPRIGALYRRIDSPLLPVLFGGGQERTLRPGTENTPMIVGLAKASELVHKNLDKYNEHFASLQTYFETQLHKKFKDLVSINCQNSPSGRLPNTTSLAFHKPCLIGSKILALTPNLRASLGAACHSSQTKAGNPSKVLIASGVSVELAQRTIRLSTGRDTTNDDIDKAIDELSHAVNELMSQQNE
ncbi:unnamed protein product [Oppiella nova]|uniref:Selenocysteine lyase n=1 Tax=Oppiella nova TaxID=334625 RepID=A0A7R9MCG0_9ACAR|nr:unnamed protein product [Oppiella nova]CAG2174656.1 unnamed protein product [Oppiella nova]